VASAGRREARDFLGPIGHQRGGNHQQARALGAAFAFLRQKQGQHLDGLAKAHVIGEAGAEAETREQAQPLHPVSLVGTQGRQQRRARVDRRAIGRAQLPKGLR
jgi:hypothetical protein